VGFSDVRFCPLNERNPSKNICESKIFIENHGR